jgi:general secretion pathway protein D
LRNVTAVANRKLKVEAYGVSIVPASFNTDALVTKEWKIPADLIPHQPADKQAAKNWLLSKGIHFNGGTSAIYLVSGSKLIVRNTQEQLGLVEKLIPSSKE